MDVLWKVDSEAFSHTQRKNKYILGLQENWNQMIHERLSLQQ